MLGVDFPPSGAVTKEEALSGVPGREFGEAGRPWVVEPEFCGRELVPPGSTAGAGLAIGGLEVPVLDPGV